MLNKEQINNMLELGKVVFATADKKGVPRCIWVMPSRITEDEIILSNIQMSKSIKNILENPNCFVNVYFESQDDLQYKITGVAKVHNKGELFEEIKEYEETNNLPEGLRVRSIIVIKITNIEESNG